MKPHWRPGKAKADTRCPQWILDGVKRIHQQATARGTNTPGAPAICRKITGEPQHEKPY